jgi:hypothetical protein
VTKLFEIQSGAPERLAPQHIARARRPRYKYPIDKMKVGDFFLYPNANSRSVSSYVSRIAKDVPGIFSTKSVWMVMQRGKWRLADVATHGATRGLMVRRDA